jgi:diaminobutyrate-2-oxoglutarate transaminase
MQVFEKVESNVRSYCRSFPAVFDRATGSHLYDRDGRRYIDFFSGAGALNYGHNHPVLKEALLDYIRSDGIAHGLDMATEAKSRFLERFDELILQPRGLPYKLMFPGPAGTTAIEAALKLARKVTGRRRVVAFTDAFHGMSLGALAVTSSSNHPVPPEAPRQFTRVLPFPARGIAENPEAMLEALGDGEDRPAAVIVETIQAEGGVHVAPIPWLRGLAAAAKARGILLIVDDIQVGCGRCGDFFSFENAGIRPDMVCLAKSISGFGLPLALTLINPDIDHWEPGEHNGTFRGNNHAFRTGEAALSHFWRNGQLMAEVAEKSRRVSRTLRNLAAHAPCQVRGLGLIFGLELPPGVAARVSRECFARGLVIETAGPDNDVLKLLPPLTTPMAVIEEGLAIIEASVAAALNRETRLPELAARSA